VKIKSKNKSNTLFEDAMIAWKTKSSIIFTSLIQMEQSKALNVDKNIIYNKLNFKF